MTNLPTWYTVLPFGISMLLDSSSALRSATFILDISALSIGILISRFKVDERIKSRQDQFIFLSIRYRSALFWCFYGFCVWFLVFSELFYFEKWFSRWVQHLVSLSIWTADGIKSDHPQVLATESHLRLDWSCFTNYYDVNTHETRIFNDFNNLYILYRVGVSTYFLTSWFLTSNPRDRTARNQFQSERNQIQ